MYSNGNQQTLPSLVMFALQVGNKYHFKWQHFNRQHSQELEAHYNKCVITRANSKWETFHSEAKTDDVPSWKYINFPN